MSMPHGLEGAKGVMESIQRLIQFPFIMRTILPGTVIVLVLYPFVDFGVWAVLSPSQFSIHKAVVVLSATILSGAFINALNGEIYKIYEGRILWPSFLFEWFRARHTCRIQRLMATAEKAKQEVRLARYHETWFRLRLYPLDDKGDPKATHPTLLGNVLSGYEDYPKSHYGMDSVFYWTRLWLQLDKEKKQEIDGTWSVADGLLGISAV